MKLSNAQIKQIIKEELQSVLKEWPRQKKEAPKPWSLYYKPWVDSLDIENSFASAIATALSVSVLLGTGPHKIPNVPEFWTIESKRIQKALRSLQKSPVHFFVKNAKSSKIIKKLEKQEILIPGQFAQGVVGGELRSVPADTEAKNVVGVPWDYDEKLMNMSLKKWPWAGEEKVVEFTKMPEQLLVAEYLFKHIPPRKLLEWANQLQSLDDGRREERRRQAEKREQKRREHEEMKYQDRLDWEAMSREEQEQKEYDDWWSAGGHDT